MGGRGSGIVVVTDRANRDGVGYAIPDAFVAPFSRRSECRDHIDGKSGTTIPPGIVVLSSSIAQIATALDGSFLTRFWHRFCRPVHRYL